MAATHTLTGSFTDLLGDSFAIKNVRGYVEASQEVVVDTGTGGSTRFGRKPLTINTDGTWTVSGLPDTSDLEWKPSGFGLRLVVDYRDDAQGTATRSQNFTSNWFPLTADTDFKDVVDIELTAVNTALRNTIHQWALDAQAAAAAAEAVGATTDAQIAGRIQDPGSETSAALFATNAQPTPQAVTYGAGGRVATRTVGEKTLTYSYNAAGQVSSVTDGITTWTYTYNADGTLGSVA